MAKLTTNQGAPIGDNQNSRTAGQNGPTLLEDYQLLEKLAHFDRERIPERVVHARGAGAHGVFKVINSMKRYTKAAFLQKEGQETPVFARFSTVIHGQHSPETLRDRAVSRSNFTRRKATMISSETTCRSSLSGTR